MAVVQSAAQRARLRQMRGEPAAIVARPVSIRIVPHLAEGSRQPAQVTDELLDARITLDSTGIPQMSEGCSPDRVRSGLVGAPHLQEPEDSALQPAQLRREDRGRGGGPLTTHAVARPRTGRSPSGPSV